ncbi:MAG TPA: hypothetical protein VFL79_15360 [Terriglobia bacterium]|nr:hypothetical protein [Terriglobia bacterium]
MTKYPKKLLVEQEGQTLPEFALLLFLVCLTVVSTMVGVAIRVNNMYSNASTHVVVASNPVLMGSGAASYAAAPATQTQINLKDATKQKPAE